MTHHQPPAFTAQILTLYPEMFPGSLGHSLAGKGLEKGDWCLKTLDIRDFASDKHRSVDDTPSGGGAGMVMRADIAAKAIDAARSTDTCGDWPLIYLSPRGRRFDQTEAERWLKAGGVTLLCGRFEGLDERVIEARNMEEISIGDFVLSGGEPAAITMLDATIRLIPGIMSGSETLKEESFSGGLLEYPQYTRPQMFEGREIPSVLTSGNHQAVADWRRLKREDLTRIRRPDLWSTYVQASQEDKN